MTDAEQDEFEGLPPALQDLVRQGMALHIADPAGGEFLFHYAISQAPEALPLYRVLYKFCNRRRSFDAAHDFAVKGLAVAARQAGLPEAWQVWNPAMVGNADFRLGSFLLLTMKAMAFIELRRGHNDEAERILDSLTSLDPGDGIGASVVAALAAGIQD
ncbi:MAG: hypothetical protein HY850_01870 [Betaproteobacteria bacterium]|nr:hypothetical protein [Betaproteobacteria bacterium]